MMFTDLKRMMWFALLLPACAHTAAPAARPPGTDSEALEVVDLTHTLTPDFPFIPVPGITFPFESSPIATLEKNGVAANRWQIHEHLGTQIDAPSHFIAGGLNLDQLPARSLIAPLAVIDIRQRAARDPDAALEVQDILDWEARHGSLPKDAAVIMYSGWDQRINDPAAFLNADANQKLHFPGISPEAARFLLEQRQVVGLGVDTISFDPGIDHTYRTHKVWLAGGARWALECVANLGLVPPAGATLYVGATKVTGATGGPVRLIATWPRGRAPQPQRPIVHVHTGGVQDALANAYLVETARGVVLIDAPMTVAQSQQLRARLVALRKPLLAVLLTHPHPDHYGGIAEVRGDSQAPVLASEQVAQIVRRDDAAKGAALARAGIAWPAQRQLPTRTMRDGEQVVFDGVRFMVRELGAAESHADAIWIMEAAGDVAAFSGDLAMRGVHPYLADGHSGAWLQTLDRLQELLHGVHWLHPGHGPGGAPAQLIGWTRDYLNDYRQQVKALAGGASKLTPEQQLELERHMAARVASGALLPFVRRGADPVAAELAAESGAR